ncbi:NAD(P)-binding protein [Daldinia caldariorum]|uniref:NAD(P)-binding protein n=1 Tax=Daldinia caldariorum TaxID=326644 RepID=UPI002007C2AE|nr:NAD(P)-binding protein [Daldinia caldariorum]KAI1463910.1 NAD(P)-binding protein [Daldinia caldariorum]
MADPKPLAGKIILVTGAAQGIGATISNYIAARGASLSLGDVQKDKLDAEAQRLSQAYPDIQVATWSLDVTDPKAVEGWVIGSKAKFGKIDGCVNNAGILGDGSRITEMSFENWSNVMNVNLTGTFNCLKFQLRAIEDGGSVVNMSSCAGIHSVPVLAAYTASKHGVVGLTKVAAAEHAHRGVRVNAVCPGIVAGGLQKNLFREVPNLTMNDLSALFQELVPMNQVAAMVGYLLGDESKFITRAVLPVDGGF